jgi:hypothetical protein
MLYLLSNKFCLHPLLIKTEFSLLISHIQSLFRMYNYFEVKYISRQANKVAHYLARAAFSMSRRRIFDSVPRYIETYLNNERC